jgi:hypothetical protein
MADAADVGLEKPPAIEPCSMIYIAACRAMGLSPNAVKLAYGYPCAGCSCRGAAALGWLSRPS